MVIRSRFSSVVVTVVLLVAPSVVLSTASPAAATLSQAPVLPGATSVAPVDTVRLAGADRYETAVRIAQDLAPDGADFVVLASGTSFPDALAAAPLAAHLGSAPVLLTQGSATPEPAVLDEIRRTGAREVVAVGGASRIPVVELDAITAATGVPWRRIAGVDREATAAAIATELVTAPAVGAGGRTAFMATGSSFPDALAAGSPAAVVGVPVLLATRDRVSPEAIDALRTTGVEHVVLLGGEGVLGPAVRTGLVAAGFTVERLAGRDRYETAAAVADWGIAQGLLDRRQVALARGDLAGGGADALAMGPAAARRRAPLLLTAGPDGPGLATAVWLQRNGVSVATLAVAGGTGSVSDASVRLLVRRAQEGPARPDCPAGCSVVAWTASDDPTFGAARLTAPAAAGATSVAVTNHLTVWARTDGTVWGYGRLASDGPAVWAFANDPQQIVGLSGIVAVSAAGQSGFAIDTDGTLWQWDWEPEATLPGRQYAPPNRSYAHAAVKVAEGVVSSSGPSAVLADGTVIAWSPSIDAGRTVVGPVRRVPGVSGMVSVAAQGSVRVGYDTGFDNLLLDLDGRVRTWRLAESGTGVDVVDPAPVALPAATAVASNGNTHLVKLADGTVASWGAAYSWVGRPAGTDRRIPALVPGLTGVATVATGDSGGLAVAADGAASWWGDTAGQPWFHGVPDDPQDSRTPQRIHFPAQLGSLVTGVVGTRQAAALFS